MTSLVFYGGLIISLLPVAWTMFHGQPLAGDVFLPMLWIAYAVYYIIKNKPKSIDESKEEKDDRD